MTAGAETVKIALRNALQKPDRATFVGSGKPGRDIRALCKIEEEIDIVVFDDELDPIATA
jgi:50S ribosomal subunit-associated GTPase HflX